MDQRPIDLPYPIYDMTPQAVTNVAMLEEIRLLGEKVKRLVVCLEREQAANADLRLILSNYDKTLYKLQRKVKKNGTKPSRNNKR